MFGLIGWIVFGLIVGFIAKLLMPGRDPGGFIITMLLGIAGAVIGGMIGRTLGWTAQRRRRVPDVVARSVLLLVLYRTLFVRKTV